MSKKSLRKKYQLLEHRTDLKIKVFGRSEKEIFLNSLLAMENYLSPLTEKRETRKRKIKLKSIDLEILLADFLNQILYLNQTFREIYSGIDFKKLSEKEIEAEILGNKVLGFKREIKAATYHDLKVEKDEDNNWQAVILFDI